jgi:4-hydroxy-L-threonine phosphate dehydrogenase PdxA
LRVGVVTGHVPLKDVASSLTKEGIKKKAHLLIESLQKDFGFERPKIAVLGLNPHAGDNGLLGAEEKEIINPVIRELKEEGHLVFGSYAADGFFGSSIYKTFDGILAMYHDQGLIPFKALAFNEGVNYTAGLPIVRTSPDHGTAYGIAGKGEADENSMRTAVFKAIDIFKKRSFVREITANPLKKQRTERF